MTRRHHARVGTIAIAAVIGLAVLALHSGCSKSDSGASAGAASGAKEAKTLSGTYQCNVIKESFEFSTDGKVKLHGPKGDNFNGTYRVAGKDVTVTLADPPPPMTIAFSMDDSGALVPPPDRQPPGGGVKYSKQ